MGRWQGYGFISQRHHWRLRDLYADGGESGASCAWESDDGADPSTREISSGVRA